jgi:two-component system chemotaxis response regulator CheB
VVIRRLLSDALSSEAGLEIAGTAPNGLIALAKLNQVNPDVVILDVEMPEMDGLQMLARLRKTHPRLPVIMFSTLTQRGAAATLDALALGANDYVTKPANVGSIGAAVQSVRAELIPKIKTFCGGGMGADTLPPPPAMSVAPVRVQPRLVRPGSQRVDVVAIGVSTGGPNALATLLPRLPADFPVPILVVQHMPPTFTALLAQRLAAQSTIQVKEGFTGAMLTPGCVWIAPGGQHMVVEPNGANVRIRTHQGPPENSCRPAADVLFRSVSKVYGAHVLAVVLTGMGQDGLRGCEQIRAGGGQILVQDESTSVVWGMPGFVARAGLADQIVPLPQLPGELVRRVQTGLNRLSTSVRPALERHR